MAPIRVVRVIARMNIGGPAIHVAGLASGMTLSGFETTLAAGLPGVTEGDMSDLVPANGVNFQRLEQLGSRIALWDDGVAFLRLFQLKYTVSHERHTDLLVKSSSNQYHF